METKTRRQREKDERRKLILEKAQELFRSNGFSGTTIRQIAQASELASGTIYLYYKDKNHIFLELINEGYDLLIDELKKLGKSETQKENLKNPYFSFINEIKTKDEYQTPIFKTFGGLLKRKLFCSQCIGNSKENSFTTETFLNLNLTVPSKFIFGNCQTKSVGEYAFAAHL